MATRKANPRPTRATKQAPKPPSNEPTGNPPAEVGQGSVNSMNTSGAGRVASTDVRGAGYEERVQDELPALPDARTDSRRGLDSLRTQRLYTAQNRYNRHRPSEE